MAEHGGYRKPSNPAPTSGPGAMSQRTDGGPADTKPMRNLPNAGYGEAAEFDAIQGGADMAGEPADPPPTAIPMGAPSQRPDEPVTAGSPMGAGVGPSGAGIEMRSEDQRDVAHLKPLLPMLEYLASQPDASPTTRAFVRRMKGNL